MTLAKNYLRNLRFVPKWLWQHYVRYWHEGWWPKLASAFVILCLLAGSLMYGIALRYQHEQKGKPTVLGVSFIADYATYFGLDPHQTYNAILTDLHVKHVRLVSYWSDIEPTPGHYDFSELDYEMAAAQAHSTKVALSIGLRQPRWPECHQPSWVDTTRAESTWEPQLNAYMQAVINRYKHNPALESYQLENEFYLSAFGECHNFDRARLQAEFSLVKRLDPDHPVTMSRSNNYAGLSLRQPLPDTVGISVYRRIWSPLTKHTLQYPFPSWYYAFLAGAEQLLTGRPSMLHELQAEPWPANGQTIKTMTLAEQNKTFDAKRLQATLAFGEQTGLKQIDLWGAEYWYYRMASLHDPSVWNTAKTLFAQEPNK